MGATTIRDNLTRMRVIPVLRFATRAAAAAAVDCLVEAGYGTVELTLTTPDALQLIAELRGRMDRAFLVGAGTVLDLDTARRCLDAGADYLVAPGLLIGALLQIDWMDDPSSAATPTDAVGWRDPM